MNTSGGSTERKSDKISWDVFQADGLDSAVNETFSSFGFRVIDSLRLLEDSQASTLTLSEKNLVLAMILRPKPKIRPLTP